MRTGRTSRIVIAIMGVLLACTVVPLATPAPASALSGDEQYFVDRINALRASVGVAPLAVDANMTDLAAAHTADMIASGGLFHAPRLSPGVSGSWAKLGENVGRGSYPDLVWNAFVSSPTHYANLVDPMFTHVGVSVMYADGLVWTTQRFVARTGGADAVEEPVRSSEPDGQHRAARRAQPQASEPEPTPEPAGPPPPPPPVADPARVSAVLDVLHATPD